MRNHVSTTNVQYFSVGICSHAQKNIGSDGFLRCDNSYPSVTSFLPGEPLELSARNGFSNLLVSGFNNPKKTEGKKTLVYRTKCKNQRHTSFFCMTSVNVSTSEKSNEKLFAMKRLRPINVMQMRNKSMKAYEGMKLFCVCVCVIILLSKLLPQCLHIKHTSQFSVNSIWLPNLRDKHSCILDGVV